MPAAESTSSLAVISARVSTACTMKVVNIAARRAAETFLETAEEPISALAEPQISETEKKILCVHDPAPASWMANFFDAVPCSARTMASRSGDA